MLIECGLPWHTHVLWLKLLNPKPLFSLIVTSLKMKIAITPTSFFIYNHSFKYINWLTGPNCLLTSKLKRLKWPNNFSCSWEKFNYTKLQLSLIRLILTSIMGRYWLTIFFRKMLVFAKPSFTRSSRMSICTLINQIKKRNFTVLVIYYSANYSMLHLWFNLITKPLSLRFFLLSTWKPIKGGCKGGSWRCRLQRQHRRQWHVPDLDRIRSRLKAYSRLHLSIC